MFVINTFSKNSYLEHRECLQIKRQVTQSKIRGINKINANKKDYTNDQ